MRQKHIAVIIDDRGGESHRKDALFLKALKMLSLHARKEADLVARLTFMP